MAKFKYQLLVLLLVSTLSCKNDNHSHFASPDYSNINKENRSRDTWQKPGTVIDALGEIEDLVIADIGAGTGYFTFRFALACKKVIAIDIDPNMIDLVEAFKINLPQNLQDKIETRLATPNSSELQKEEADIIALVNTISYIAEQKNYLSKLYDLLPSGGKLMIVDFHQSGNVIGPEVGDHHITATDLSGLLTDIGFSEVMIDVQSLAYQYIAIAVK